VRFCKLRKVGQTFSIPVDISEELRNTLIISTIRIKCVNVDLNKHY